MEINEGIHRIDTPLGERLNTLWLITGSRGALLFECGMDGVITDHVIPYLDLVSVDPERVQWAVATHCDVDHFGGIAEIHEVLPNARVVAHHLDADLMEDYAVYEQERARGFRSPFGLDEDPAVLKWTRWVTREGPVDCRASGDEIIDLGDRRVHIMHVPGHSLGHLAVRDLKTGTLLVSDAVLGDFVPLANGTPSFPPTYRYVDPYLSTIKRLRSLDPPCLGTAHYGHMDALGAIEFLDVSTDFTHRLDAAVRETLRTTGPMTLAELLDALNPIGTWPSEGTAGALAFPVVGHLERLLANGEITLRLDNDGIARMKVAT